MQSTTQSIDLRVSEVLNQDREADMFLAYTVSEQHKTRMASLPAHIKSFDRPKWKTHPNYHTRRQMPDYHVNFRLEMQALLQSVWQALK